LTTGRPHQIRLQCAGRGHPVAGDARYGAERDAGGRHIALHHTLVRVEHPATRRVETFAAPPPDWWDAVLTPVMREVAARVLEP
jgi:23S rRNA-/tRNA-specific pseudouridylate synthase